MPFGGFHLLSVIFHQLHAPNLNHKLPSFNLFAFWPTNSQWHGKTISMRNGGLWSFHKHVRVASYNVFFITKMAGKPSTMENNVKDTRKIPQKNHKRCTIHRLIEIMIHQLMIVRVDYAGNKCAVLGGRRFQRLANLEILHLINCKLKQYDYLNEFQIDEYLFLIFYFCIIRQSFIRRSLLWLRQRALN